MHTLIYTHKYINKTTSIEHWWPVMFKTILRSYAKNTKYRGVLTVISGLFFVFFAQDNLDICCEFKCRHVDFSRFALNCFTIKSGSLSGNTKKYSFFCALFLPIREVGTWVYLNESCHVFILLKIKSACELLRLYLDQIFAIHL